MRRCVLATLVVLAGCGGGFRNTLLPTATDGRAAPEFTVQIPTGFDVQSVDYDAALVGLASGDSVSTSTAVAGKGVLAVYAIERATQRSVVFVFDDIQMRPTPSAVIWLTERAAPVARAAED